MGIESSICFFTFYNYARTTFLLFALLAMVITVIEHWQSCIIPRPVSTARLFLIHLTTQTCTDIIFTAAKKLAFLIALKIFRYVIQSFTIMFIVPAVGHIVYIIWLESTVATIWNNMLSFDPYRKVSSEIVEVFGQMLVLIAVWGAEGTLWYSPNFPYANVLAGIHFFANIYQSYEAVLGNGSPRREKFYTMTAQITIETVIAFIGSFVVVKGMDRFQRFISPNFKKTPDIFIDEQPKCSSVTEIGALSENQGEKVTVSENYNGAFPKKRSSGSHKNVFSSRSQNITASHKFSAASFYNECFRDRVDNSRPIGNCNKLQSRPSRITQNDKRIVTDQKPAHEREY